MKQGTLVRQDLQQESAPTAQAAVRPRILVVDHHDTARLAACEWLTLWGFDVVGEDNGVSGLAYLAQSPQTQAFSGMLLELDMPVLGGMAVLQEMKDRYPTVPVIVMAEARQIDKLREAVRLWAQEYIVKPFDTELLKMKCTYVFSSPLRRT